MHRRKFLGTIALGAGATALPVWLSRAFRLGDDTACSEPVDVDLGTIETQMSDPGRCLPGNEHVADKPRLIFVIPTDDRLQYTHGRAFGELLNHGSDEQLAPLACFEVACRRLADLGPNWRGGLLHEPLMVLIDSDGSMQPLDGQLAEAPPDRLLEDDVAEQGRIDARIDLLARLISSAADGTRLVERACSERASLPPADLALLDDLPHSLGTLVPAHVDRAPASTLLLTRSGEPDVRQHLTALLAAAVRMRLCQQPIDGAPWARATGCGTVVEGETRNSGIMCGMGNVPERSRRFLKFYVSDF